MRKLVDTRKGLKLLGHPVHSLLIHFPMAFLSVVFPLEVLAWSGWTTAWTLAFWAHAAGVAAALPAALAGLPDLIALKDRPAASGTGNLHMLAMTGAAGLFGLGLFLKGGTAPVLGGMAFVILGLSLSGTLLLLAGGWLGGELVYRHGAAQS